MKTHNYKFLLQFFNKSAFYRHLKMYHLPAQDLHSPYIQEQQFHRKQTIN